ncbi:MAG: hypothetical protein GX434_18665 [Peptococcaceae bacterium]|nr:hypothetical protein [Peptococcaceae bacterium]
MNEVFSLLPGISEKAMDEMAAQAKKLGKDMEILPEEIIPAMYQALSAGVLRIMFLISLLHQTNWL